MALSDLAVNMRSARQHGHLDRTIWPFAVKHIKCIAKNFLSGNDKIRGGFIFVERLILLYGSL
jgi:hypothetical protein